MTRKAVLVAVAVLASIGAAGCGSRVADTNATTAPSSTRAPVKGTTAPTTSTPSTTTTAKPGATTTTTAASPSSSAAPTTTAPPAGGEYADFCEKTKLLDLSDVTAFEAYDAASAAKLVFTFDKIQKAAPPELTDAFKAMRPLVEELNQKVKAGEVHDRESLKAWLLGLNQTNPAALEQWVQGQATVAPFVKEHCA